RLAAAARALPARDERPRRVRGRRRARALGQTRRARRRRGVDGGLAHPPVPRRRMTAVAVADLRPVDLFDDLDDGELEEWAAAREWREAQPGGVVAEQGEVPVGMTLLLEGTLQTMLVERGRAE